MYCRTAEQSHSGVLERTVVASVVQFWPFFNLLQIYWLTSIVKQHIPLFANDLLDLWTSGPICVALAWQIQCPIIRNSHCIEFTVCKKMMIASAEIKKKTNKKKTMTPEVAAVRSYSNWQQCYPSLSEGWLPFLCLG